MSFCTPVKHPDVTHIGLSVGIAPKSRECSRMEYCIGDLIKLLAVDLLGL